LSGADGIENVCLHRDVTDALPCDIAQHAGNFLSECWRSRQQAAQQRQSQFDGSEHGSPFDSRFSPHRKAHLSLFVEGRIWQS